MPLAISRLRSKFLGDTVKAPRARQAIYIRRGANFPRRLVNEDAILALCEELGITTVVPEEVGIIAQAELFHAADLVVGVKGAALTNALFCLPPTHIVALSPGDFPDPFFWDLVRRAGSTIPNCSERSSMRAPRRVRAASMWMWSGCGSC